MAKPLSDDALNRIRQWTFNGSSSSSVTAMRDDLLATIAARDEQIGSLQATIAARDEESETRRLVAQANKGTAERLRVRVVQLEEALRDVLDNEDGVHQGTEAATCESCRRYNAARALLSGSPKPRIHSQTLVSTRRSLAFPRLSPKTRRDASER